MDGTDRTRTITYGSVEASGTEAEGFRNPVLSWLKQQFPAYSQGNILFFMLPLEVRRKIYEYHEIDYLRSAKINKSKRRIQTPLSQTCRTFRREIHGLALSRRARFSTEEDMQNFVKLCRTHHLPSFVCYITLDLGSPRSELKSFESIRDILLAANRQFEFVNAVTFSIQSARTSGFITLRRLMQDGTMEQFIRLETVHVTDYPVQGRYKTYNQRDRAFIHAKIREWKASGDLQKPIDTELLAVARCMMRLAVLNAQLNGMIGRWRRNRVGSGVDVESDQITTESPCEETTLSPNQSSIAPALETGQCQAR